MNSRPATAEDFDRWETRAQSMSASELFWAVRDCATAARAMHGHDYTAEGRYLDEMAAYTRELDRRRRAGTLTR